MRKVQYGSTVIKYKVQIEQGLKSHYITVDKQAGVVLKGSSITGEMGDGLILKKAKWILQKMKVVQAIDSDKIVTGSRIIYLGKSYYTQVVVDNLAEKVLVKFNHSKFIVTINESGVTQTQISAALNDFYKRKFTEKIIPRAYNLAYKINLIPANIKPRRMSKRWGSCTATNKIMLNIEAIKLPYTLIDYLITHELCHIKVKDHSKKFWAELSKHISNWKLLDERINLIHL